MMSLFSMVMMPIRHSAKPISVIAVSFPRALSTSTGQKAPASSIEDVLPASDSSLASPGPTEEIIKSFDPVAQSKARGFKLPRSRYQARPPRYDRGPLNPYQPLPANDPNSPVFVPGPFSLPRMQQTYETTLAPDLMTLMYMHIPPGYKPPPPPPRLRPWDNSSPYHKNRPLRSPRGGDVLRLLRKPITFRNVPKLEAVTIHSFVSGATESSAYLHVAGMALQAITNSRTVVHRAKESVSQWDLKRNTAISLTAELRGENMYHFLGKLATMILPRIKEWPGIKGSSGDSSGNISFGWGSDVTAMFPEIEVNYDSYPPKMIPGVNVTIHTSARNDRDARMLLMGLGFPFFGKFIN